MSWIQGKFQSQDGLSLHFRYAPSPQADETLILLHGHGEHSGRYEKFTTYLQKQNLNLAIYDARGHGLSEGEPVYVRRYQDYLDDLTCFVNHLRVHFGLAGRFYLLGHSNGGLVAVHWALQNPGALQALFLSSPFLGSNLPQPLIGMNWFFNHTLPHLIYQNPIYPPYLTHNTEEVARYKKDPLIRRKITVRLLAEMLSYQRRLESIPEVRFSFPVSILMAGMERVVSPSATHDFFEKLRAPDKNLKVFDGFYHEIFNELSQEKVFEALNHYLEKARKYTE